MEFKEGDKVRVFRYKGEDVDFYGRISQISPQYYFLDSCTEATVKLPIVLLNPNNIFYGSDRRDYYVLAEDEEDTEGGNNMPTIKRKVEMNLPELIEWGCKNEIEGERYLCNKSINKGVSFNSVGNIEFDFVYTYSANDTFTVEIEEPITEDTVFDKLISRYVFLSSKPSYAHAINVSIKEVIEDRKKATHIYFENEDNELQLIWKNGKLVE